MSPSIGLVEGVDWWEVARGERAEAEYQGRLENVRGLQLQRRERPAFGDISNCAKKLLLQHRASNCRWRHIGILVGRDGK